MDALPASWDVVTLGQLAERGVLWFQNGFAEGNYNTSGFGIPHLRPFNVTTNGEIDLSQLKYIPPPPQDSPYWVQRGDILFNNTNSEELVGKAALFALEGPFALSNHMTILRVLDLSALDPYWLACQLLRLWQLGTFRALCRRHVNQASIGLTRLAGVTILRPPLAEQRAIVQVLHAVQCAREATERVLAAARALKGSLMRHLFTYGPMPVQQAEQVELRETTIGAMPAHWKPSAIHQLVTSTQYGISERAELQGAYPILRMNNLQGGRLDTNDLKYVNLGHSDLQRFQVHKGDILFNRTNSFELVGKTALFDLDAQFIFASYLVRLAIDRRLCVPEYLNQYMNWEITQHRLKQLASRGVSQSNISASKLRGFEVASPPVEEQQIIAHLLQVVDTKIAAEEARRAALDVLFNSMLQQLMTGHVRVPHFAQPETAKQG